MSIHIQKNRYLALNGDRLGEPYWKNLCLSYAFIAAVGTGCAANLLLTDDNPVQKKDFQQALLLSGTLAITSLRYKRMILFSRLGFSLTYKKNISYDDVIDTRPEQRATVAQKKAASAYLLHIGGAGTVYLGSAAIAPFVVFDGKPEYLLPASTFIAPYFAEGASMLYRALKVGKGDWTIIDKNKMKPEFAPSTLMQPI